MEVIEKVPISLIVSKTYRDMLDKVAQNYGFNRQEAVKFLITQEFSKLEEKK